MDGVFRPTYRLTQQLLVNRFVTKLILSRINIFTWFKVLNGGAISFACSKLQKTPKKQNKNKNKPKKTMIICN